MVLVADVDEAARFLVRGFGFTCRVKRDGYAFLCDDTGRSAVRLVEADPGTDLADPRRQVTVYIDVDDVDAMWERHRAYLTSLPEGRVRPPFDQPYGQREFHAIHGPVLFFVGAPIRRD